MEVNSEFYRDFVNCVDEHSVSEGRIGLVVQTTARNKDEVRQWIGEYQIVFPDSFRLCRFL